MPKCTWRPPARRLDRDAEALAAGVPVLGYAYGGTAELVEHQVSGYLVQPGDVDGLVAAGVAGGRTPSAERRPGRAAQYPWARAIEQYAAIYHDVAEQRRKPSRVSVVITNYNYGQYLDAAVQSCLDQTRRPAHIVLVDDGSTDDTPDRINAWKVAHPGLITAAHQVNSGVAAARNYGVSLSDEDYIICLDADDMLDARYVAACQQALDAQPGAGVAYTGLGILAADGSVQPNAWPPSLTGTRRCSRRTRRRTAFRARRCSAVRPSGHARAATSRSTRRVKIPSFHRGLAAGFDAVRVTDEPLFHYRVHDGSASRTKEYRPIDAGTRGCAMASTCSPLAKTRPIVRSYADPLVSVVIPVGPNHAQYLPAALDSLLGQTLRAWEVIVVPNRAAPPDLTGVPVCARRHRRQRPSRRPQRRSGARACAAGAVPGCRRLPDARRTARDGRSLRREWRLHLQRLVRAARRPDGRAPGARLPARGVAGEWAARGHRADRDGARPHGRRVRRAHAGMGRLGLFIKLAIAGVCGRRPQPLLVYRQETGTVREASLAQKDTLLAVLRDRYAGYATGEKPMSTCCGGADAILAAKLRWRWQMATHLAPWPCRIPASPNRPWCGWSSPAASAAP